MGIVKQFYKICHPHVAANQIPEKYNISMYKAIMKPIRKWFSAVIIPTIPFNGLRVTCYRWAGYKVGGGTFIGMRCYLDDMCYDKITIGKNVTISYGVYFACHGKKQGHNKICIEDDAYIGMRASIIAKEDIIIGKGAIVGACSLVNKSVANGDTVVGLPAKSVHHANN